MNSKAPPEIRLLLLDARKREADERRHRLERKRADARERDEHLRKAAPLVQKAQAWAEAFAQEQALPDSSVEVFASEGKKAEVTSSGQLVFRCWAKYYGWPKQQLEYVPIEFLERLVEAIESGTVWVHVEKALVESAQHGAISGAASKRDK